ncbi:helix-hairpin-helix domain-containing protein [Companilactobacillus keshanensis]|uniref:Helix-hairpin-helix domain-containing protein n=1 Tax=Companilactobacillus keshanensis TaxID=2486003 RepID=A0ABW4BW43_9LACO|nr:helix-hairpin-helix domain-containing protein [Companilactobacillus keshanensis]
MEKVIKVCRENLAVIVLLFLLLGFGVWNLTHKAQIKSVPVATSTVVQKKTAPKKELTNKGLVIDIQGAVNNPGVYHLRNGAIVQEAIKLSGGLVENADAKQINQAQKVTDQMQIIVPRVGEPSSSTSNGGADIKKQVNINTAKVEDFQSVTGIGPKKAEKIIAFREQNGNFKELKDLTKVSGIGDKTLESLKDQLTV